MPPHLFVSSPRGRADIILLPDRQGISSTRDDGRLSQGLPRSSSDRIVPSSCAGIPQGFSARAMSFSALRRHSARRQSSTAAVFFVSRRGARFRPPQSEPARQRAENSPLQSADGGYESSSTFSSEAHVRAHPAGQIGRAHV